MAKVIGFTEAGHPIYGLGVDSGGPLCPECGAPEITVNAGNGPVKLCNSGHKRPLPSEIPEGLAHLVGEIAEPDPDEDPELGILANVVSEMTATPEQLDQLCPVAQGHNRAAIIGEDDNPLEVIVEVAAGESRNKRIWSREALAEIAKVVQEQGLPGYKGHQKPEDVGRQFIDPATHWIGAREYEPGKFYFRGIVDEAESRLKRNVRTKQIRTVSIFGAAKAAFRGGKQVVKSFKPMSIDWTPLGLAGMPSKVVAMGETIDKPGVQPPEGPDEPKGGKMDLAEIIGEMRKEGVKPSQVIGEMNWSPEDVVKATGLPLDKVGPALASEEWEALQAGFKTFGEIVEVLGEKDPDKIKKAIEDGKEALKAQNTAGHDKIVGEVLEAKVHGETSQQIVKDMLHLTGSESKEEIEKILGETLEKPHVKLALKATKGAGREPVGAGAGGSEGGGSGTRVLNGLRSKKVRI